MSESQWNYLGLSHNPFSDPQKEFFPGADREMMLGKVRKLSQWSRPVLAVTGPHGVGKTCLFRALSSSLEAGVVAARVNGSLVSRAGDVLSALVQGYGVAAPAGADAPLLIELIIGHLKDQIQKDRTSLVLVDDAHLLEQRAVDDLINLAAAGAKLAFFSEPQFVESLQRAVERNAETSDNDELLWQEMLLSPFSREQTGDYLAWRFEEAGYNGRMPFSEYQGDGIHRTSEGYPGRLDFAANEQLMLMTVGGARTAGIPRKHLWLAGALAGVLGLTLWLWSPGQDLEIDSKSVAVELPKPETSGDSVAVVGQPKPALSRTVQPLPAESVVPKEFEPVANPSRTVRVDPPAVTPTPVAKPTPPPSTPVAVAPRIAVAPRVADNPRAADNPRPATTASGSTTSTPARSAEGYRNAAWLLAQSDASYTIQLIGLSTEERANAYLAKQDRLEQFALFRAQSGDRLVHVVAFGVYTSKAEADAAAAQLPASVGKVTPWVRPIRSVKGSIRTALQSSG